MSTKRRFGKLKDFLKKNPATKKIVANHINRRFQKQNERMKLLVQKYGLEYLSEITLGLRQAGLSIFADFGTLLGVVREQGLMKHDADVDTSVILRTPEDYKVVGNFMREHGYKMRYEYVFQGAIQEQSFVKNGLKLDVCYYTVEDDKMSCLLFYCEEGKEYTPNIMDVVRKTYPLQTAFHTTEVQGYSVVIPDDAENFLAEKYGSTWRIPDKGWVYWKGPNTSGCIGTGEQHVLG